MQVPTPPLEYRSGCEESCHFRAVMELKADKVTSKLWIDIHQLRNLVELSHIRPNFINVYSAFILFAEGKLGSAVY